MKTPQERFEQKFIKSSGNQCWEWTACKVNTGYGWFGFQYKGFLAHRFSWMLYVGDIPDGLFVLHKCDNRACVRPDHLFLGTQTENMQDCVGKGRCPLTNAKLTEEQVVAIRAMWLKGSSNSTLAKEFKVKRSNISNITHYHTWTRTGTPPAEIHDGRKGSINQ